jgi:hypothetical protein
MLLPFQRCFYPCACQCAQARILVFLLVSLCLSPPCLQVSHCLTYQALGTCGGFCAACDLGTYSTGGTSFCNYCGAGKTSSSGASACVSCVPGPSCAPCDAGLVPAPAGPGPRPANCVACAAGTIYPRFASTACEPCARGKQYSAVAGATVCLECTARCPGANYHRVRDCSPTQDLQCQQFQAELALGSKALMLCTPLLVFAVLAAFIRCGPRVCIPPLLQELRGDMPDGGGVSRAWSAIKRDRFFTHDPGVSLKAALWSLLVAAMDQLSNVMLLILLSSDAPNGMFVVALVSLVSTLTADVLACCRFFMRPSNLRFVWLYILECQELDPEWRQWKSMGKAQGALRRIKLFKLFKAATNNAPSYYVQVQFMGREPKTCRGVTTSMT